MARPTNMGHLRNWANTRFGQQHEAKPSSAWRRGTPIFDDPKKPKQKIPTQKPDLPPPIKTPEDIFKEYFGLDGERDLMESLHADGALLCGVLRDQKGMAIMSAYGPINRYIICSVLGNSVGMNAKWLNEKAETAKEEFIKILTEHKINLCQRIRELDTQKDNPRLEPGRDFSNDEIIELCVEQASLFLGNLQHALEEELFADTEIPKHDVQQILNINLAGDAAERTDGETHIFGHELG